VKPKGVSVLKGGGGSCGALGTSGGSRSRGEVSCGQEGGYLGGNVRRASTRRACKWMLGRREVVFNSAVKCPGEGGNGVVNANRLRRKDGGGGPRFVLGRV